MGEMNALLEGKIEAEARADKAENDSNRLQEQLSTYDRNAAQEQGKDKYLLHPFG
jgi:hypothetical protein